MSTPALDPALIDIVWWGTRDLRVSVHRARGGRGCPSPRAPYGLHDPLARRLHPRCWDDGCLGVLHQVYALTIERLDGGTRTASVTTRAAYARRVVETVQVDLARRERVRRGLPAKPTRSDGVPGRVNAALLQGNPDPVRAAWLITLFRLLRSWVCRVDRVTLDWPIEAWAAQKSAADGRTRRPGSRQTAAEIRADVAEVLQVAERVAGSRWVNDTLRAPLSTVVLPWPGWEPTPAMPGADVPTNAEWSILVQRYAASRAAGAGPGAALHEACRSVFGVSPAGDASDLVADLESLAVPPRRKPGDQSVDQAHPMP